MPAAGSFASPSTIATPRSVWRSIILPREHGSWALALEPVLLGLAAAPSWPGVGWALAAVALFLTRRPQQIAVKRDARLVPATGALLSLSVVAVAAASWALTQGDWHSGIPLVIALPAAAVFVWFDRRKAGRETVAEMAGATFFAAFPAAIAVAAGRDLPLAVALAGFALARAATSILPIRAHLRKRKREPISTTPSAVAVVTACLGFAAWGGRSGSWIPFLWTVVFALFAWWLLGSRAPIWPAKRLGITQMVLGVIVMITTGIALGSG